jgi:hypothetical protein
VEQRIVTSRRFFARTSVDTLAAIFLFATSAAVVLWQNLRLTSLWDVSYILENATRIAAGDVPYRNFPFPYAPLTFVVQAAIIRTFGRVYWHHIAYAAIACGAASVLAFAIARRLLPFAPSLLITLPLSVLGIYCIVPNPFYDPDCCLAILIGLFLLCASDGDSFVGGALCIVPLFIKQNIGLAFLVGAAIAFLLTRRWRSLGGLAIAATLALAIVAAVFGIHDYYRWTIEFAALRRLRPLAEQFGMYDDPDLYWWLAFGVAGLAVPRGLWLMAMPFLWTEYRFFISDDPNEAENNLLRAWPFFLILALIAAFAGWRRERGFLRLLPFVLIGTIHGAFLSQGTWGSTYGIWPLLLVLMAMIFRYTGPSRIAIGVIALVLVHLGIFYVVTNKRLAYAKWNDGPMRTSSLPALRGLHMRGEWLPEFEELVTFAGRQIPRQDAILFLPGEDLFYFTTGRRPRVPVLMLDRTVNPYSPGEIAALDARWVIVKRRLQINGVPDPDLGTTLPLLGPRLSTVAHLANYDVYRYAAPVPRTSANAQTSAHPVGGDRDLLRSASVPDLPLSVRLGRAAAPARRLGLGARIHAVPRLLRQSHAGVPPSLGALVSVRR